jgi:transposase
VGRTRRGRVRIWVSRPTRTLAASLLQELQTLRRTLMRWRQEILAYFATGLTNGRTEGFNNKAKVVKSALTGIGASGTTDSDS